jgi:hypothetical protein
VRLVRSWPFTHAGQTLLVVLTWLTAWASGDARQPSPVRRAKPSAHCQSIPSGIFEPNAFTLLRGDRPGWGQQDQSESPPLPEVDREFDRLDLMLRLSRATTVIETRGPANDKMGQGAAPASRALNEFAVVALRIKNEDPDYSADGDYIRHARALIEAGKLLKNANDRADEGRRSAALRAVRRACHECHRQFNP